MGTTKADRAQATVAVVGLIDTQAALGRSFPHDGLARRGESRASGPVATGHALSAAVRRVVSVQGRMGGPSRGRAAGPEVAGFSRRRVPLGGPAPSGAPEATLKVPGQ